MFQSKRSKILAITTTFTFVGIGFLLNKCNKTTAVEATVLPKCVGSTDGSVNFCVNNCNKSDDGVNSLDVSITNNNKFDLDAEAISYLDYKIAGIICYPASLSGDYYFNNENPIDNFPTETSNYTLNCLNMENCPNVDYTCQFKASYNNGGTQGGMNGSVLINCGS